jgi:hypothetical protein
MMSIAEEKEEEALSEYLKSENTQPDQSDDEQIIEAPVLSRSRSVPINVTESLN